MVIDFRSDAVCINDSITVWRGRMRRRIGPVITSVLRIPRSASSIPASRVTPLSDGEGLPPARTLQGVQHRADESSGARLPSLRGCLAALYGHRKPQGARTTDSTISWWVGDDAEGLAWIGLIRKRPEKAAKLGVHCDSTLRPRTYLILPRVQFQSGDPDWKHLECSPNPVGDANISLT